MDKISMIAIDLAKRVFQIHGIDEDGNVCLKRRLRRSQLIEFFATLKPCVVGMEACATAHHWARQLSALGHEVRLVPPLYVKPFVQRQKNDAADAAAICEAMRRPAMQFVPVKTEEQQATQMALRARELLVRQRTMSVNGLRSHLAEFGIIAPTGRNYVAQLAERLNDPELPVPPYVRETLLLVVRQIEDSDQRIEELDQAIARRCKDDDMAQLLMTVPGIGPITASTILAAAPDPRRFRSGRHFAAWIGLVPLQRSSGDKQRLGRISKMGNRSLRRLLINAAMNSIIVERRRTGARGPWLAPMLARKPILVTACAFANKLARVIWAMMMRREVYNPQ